MRNGLRSSIRRLSFNFWKPETLISGRRRAYERGKVEMVGSSGPLDLWNAETAAAAAAAVAAGAENVESNLEAEKKKEGGEQSMPSMPAASGTNSSAFFEGKSVNAVQRCAHCNTG